MKFFEIEKRRYGAIVKFHNDYDDNNNDDDGDGDENDDDYDDNDERMMIIVMVILSRHAYKTDTLIFSYIN